MVSSNSESEESLTPGTLDHLRSLKGSAQWPTLELPEELSNVHNTFYVSNLKKCISDESLVIPMKELRLDDKLNFVEEPIEIMDREVKQLKQSRIPIVKVVHDKEFYELFTPYKEPEREFLSSRRHFKTLSLDELRSPDFNLLFDQEYSEEEEEEAMAETMEQYMSKTRTDYGSGELRENTFSGSDNEDANEHIEKVLKIVDLFHVPNITVDQLMLQVFPISLTGAASRWLRNEPTGSIKTWEDLKTKFLNKYCPPGRTAKKMEEINNFQQEPDETLFQAWERFKELLMKGAIPTMTAADAKKAIQEMAEYSQKWHNGTSRGRSTENSDGLAAIQAQLNNLGREIKKERGFGSLPSSTETNPRDQVKSISTTTEADSYSIHHIGSSQYAVSTGQNSTLLYKSRQMTVPFPSRLDNHYCEEEEGNYGPKFMEAYGASHINDTIPRKEKDPGSFTLPCFINKTCFDNSLVDLGDSVSVMPLSTYLNLGLGKLAHTRLTVELADRTVKYPKGIAENVLVGIGKFTFLVEFIIHDMPEDIKVPLILGRLFLSTTHAKIDVYKRKITLRVGEERIIFKSVKPASSLIKRVYMLSLRERMKLDLEARLMGETWVLNRSLDTFLEDYIELNDLNEPFELRRNQGDDLMPTIEEGEVIEEFRTRYEDLDTGIDDYPSYCDNDKKIHIDCYHNLKFSCMIGFEFTHVNFYPLLYVNVMSKEFHNSIMKDKMVYKGDNVVGALMNVPIFVGTFSVMTDFAILEDMDAYRDEGMGDIIVGKPFLREAGIKTKRFEGIITFYNGDDEVTYQMVRSYPRSRMIVGIRLLRRDFLITTSILVRLVFGSLRCLISELNNLFVICINITFEEPEQAPLSLDYVPGQEYSEYLDLSDEEVPIEDQPYAVADSPIALSLGYIADSDPEEDPEDESEDGPTDYPANGGDDDDDDSSGDDADDEDEEEATEEDKEKEEHLAPTDSTAAASPVVDLVPSAEDVTPRQGRIARQETEPCKTDKSAATPPPPPAYQVDRLLDIPTLPSSPLTSLSSPLPQIPSPPFLVPSPPTTSPTYTEAPLGYRAAGI
ncbi:retrovirus-related pol polyprotein from transposon TNT 1-94 [Tanacetum coccineum]|uniref:Retrovirus-related pol polyprotein from transposon TNT 1-94 n=1 Tax=Tanacetum coccineum TaxID=301880 RepID=A0ABQ5CVG4_9ASTR